MASGEYKKAARYLQDRVKTMPQVGIICGSGLSGLSKLMTDTQVFNYDSIPGFPQVHVQGHVGELVFGFLADVPTVCMRGRFHFYEGHSMEKVVLGVRVMRCLGAKAIVVTNAAGGLNPDFNVGDVVCVQDHFALPLMSGNNPLMGPNDNELGPRFPPISNAYTDKLRDIVVNAGKTLNYDFIRPKGCYAFVSGPSYEAPTEASFLRKMGSDCVGMSTIPELVAAHHCGMKVIGLSLITNKVLLPGDTGEPPNHKEVLETADRRASQMQALVKEIVSSLKDELASMEELPKIDFGAKAKGGKKGGKAAKKPAKKAGKKGKATVMKKAMKGKKKR